MKSNAIAAQPATFTFQSLYPVRVIDIKGDPWFVAVDVCQVLNLDPTAVRKLDADERGLHSAQTPGGTQRLAVINESGLYTLVMRCRDATKPGSVAHRFRKWVTAEVLPAIRRTGSFSMPAKSRRTPGAELLTANDMANLRRVIFRITAGSEDAEGWIRVCWQSLRQAAGIAAGDRFEVAHLPDLVDQLRRFCTVADAVRELTNRITSTALQELKNGKGLVDISAAIWAVSGTMRIDKDPLKLATWTQREFDALARRLPAAMDHPEAAELS